jgi:hypothetical protein
MSIYDIAAAGPGQLAGRIMRRALIGLAIAAFCVVALYYFTAAGMLALAARFGQTEADIIVAAIYAALAASGYLVLLAMARRTANAQTRQPLVGQTREAQIVMLLEALMLGYSLSRKGGRGN